MFSQKASKLSTQKKGSRMSLYAARIAVAQEKISATTIVLSAIQTDGNFHPLEFLKNKISARLMIAWQIFFYKIIYYIKKKRFFKKWISTSRRFYCFPPPH